MIKYDYEITVNGNQAKLNKDIYLFRGNKNVHYYFAVKNASFNFKGSTDLIEKTNAINAAVTVIKPNNVEVASAIAKVENGKIHLKVTEDLIDEEVEVGDFDLVFDLFDDTDGAVTIPKVIGQFHVLERPCTTPISELVATNTTNEVDQALTDYAIVTYAEPVASTNADGTFAKKTWVAKEKITTAELNRMEEGISDVSSQCKDIANLSLTKHTDGKVYIKKQDGTLIGDGIEIGGSDVDLSKITMSMSGQTLKLLNNGDQVATVEIPTATVTDEQLTSIIQSKIDDGTLSALSIENRSIDESKLNFGIIHKHLLNDTLKNNLANSEIVKLNKEYISNYTQATINNDGTLNTKGIAYVTEFLKCYPNEVLDLSKPVHTKVAFYDKNKVFISITTITNTTTNYTVPNDAYYFRLESDYNGGTPAIITIRANKFKNKTFKDLVCSPLKCKPKIQITGDSNTYGYGLSSTSLSWANLFISQLQTLTTFRYFPNSKWVISRGANSYDINYNFKQYSSMEIDTDAENMTLSIGTNYDSAWKWYIDGITNSSNDNQSTIALDGNLHTVKVEFTAGQAVLPSFQITKSIECKNNAVSGVATGNVTIETGYDWLLLMVGTNNRNINNLFFQDYNKYEYCGKATYIVPFPTWKIEEGYTASLMQMATNLIESFKDMGFDILNCLDVASTVFCDTTKYYQGDLIHFNENGHKLICNIISAKLGLPTYLSFSN